MNSEKQKLIADFASNNREKLYRTAFMYLGEREAALDALSEATISALKSADSLRQPEYASTWFYRILINKCTTDLKKRQRFKELNDSEEEPVRDGEKEETIDLKQGIESLSPEHRIVIILRYYEDMKISEIAKALGANESTVKSRISAALKRLRLRLED